MRYGQRPSRLLNLSACLSEAGCLDFDQACADLGFWAEGRSHETKEEPAPKKPRSVVHVPAYETVADLLGLDEDEEPMDGEADMGIDEAARELLTGKVDWRTFGVD